MRIFKSLPFAKSAKKQGLTNEALVSSMKEVASGLTGVALGGNLFKKRVAVGSKGKSGGLRTIIVFMDSSEKIFCIYLYAKNEKDNISSTELEALKRYGRQLLSLTDKELEEAVVKERILEVRQP